MQDTGSRRSDVLGRSRDRCTYPACHPNATGRCDRECPDPGRVQMCRDADGFQLISIAHRLQTVAYYDRIIVMDKGRITESGRPLALYEDTTSLFRQLCDTKVRHTLVYLSDRASDKGRKALGNQGYPQDSRRCLKCAAALSKSDSSATPTRRAGTQSISRRARVGVSGRADRFRAVLLTTRSLSPCKVSLRALAVPTL